MPTIIRSYTPSAARTLSVLARFTLWSAATTISGCMADVRSVEPMPMPWGQRVVMSCTGDKSMTVDFVPAPRAARVTVDSTTVTLPQVDAASDAKFTDGNYTLYINDNRAALEQTGMVVRGPCRPQ